MRRPDQPWRDIDSRNHGLDAKEPDRSRDRDKVRNAAIRFVLVFRRGAKPDVRPAAAQSVGSMSPMFCGRFVSKNQSSAGVARMSDHKSTRYDVGALLSKTSAMLAQKTRRRVPSACARSFHRTGPRQ